MKKMMKLLTTVAAAAMGLTACQNSFEENDVNGVVKGSVVVSFVSEEARTSVDTSGDAPIFSWGEEESFEVLEQTDALVKALSVAYTNVGGKANIDAEFALNTGKDEYKYVAVYPKTAYVSADNINTSTLTLPAEQSAVVGSYDSNADLMVSMPVVTTAQPTEAQPMRFTRLAAVVELSINNLTLAADEVVECVEFTANGKNLAGTINADLENPHEFTINSGVSSVSVATASQDKVYFTVLPTTLDAGDAYSVVVETDQHIYIKQGVIPDGKSLVFEAGKVSRFGVNMTDAVVADKWKLVRDASTLKEGDIVAIVAKDYDKALSTKLHNNVSETSTYAKRDAADISKSGNYLVSTTDVQQLILMTGLADNTFSFYDEARKKFLVSTNTSSTHLRNQEYCSVDTSFAITIDSATTAATITNTEGDYKGNLLRYHTGDYFTSNKNSSSTYKDVCIYRLEGAEGVIPTIDANVTIDIEDDEYVTIAEEGEESAKTIEEVVFNYVGDWTISVEDNADWLEVVYNTALNCLTYTSLPNEAEKRNTVVTINATLGDKTLSWTFNILQKGAPQEISIEEFGALKKDENSTYKLTGKVTTLATNATSSGYVLSDENGNTATIKYLDTEDGENVWGHDDFSIQLGDVMTVVVVPMGNNVGGNNTYPSIYKGHYRLAVSAGVAADYTGGSVAIEVATSSRGSIVLPTTPVTGELSACDYATFTYTDGADSATVTFTSANETSDAREATATFTYGLTSASVTVQQGVNPANKIGWELVTDASTLAIGDEVIIVAKNADKALACPTSTSQANFPVANISKTGNVIYDVEETNTQIFSLGEGVNTGTFSFDFTYNDKGYRLYYSTQLKMRLTSNGINAATSWTISIEADGNASILSTKLLKFNGATSTTFSMQTVGSTNAGKAEFAVCIYKKQDK